MILAHFLTNKYFFLTLYFFGGARGVVVVFRALIGPLSFFVH